MKVTLTFVRQFPIDDCAHFDSIGIVFDTCAEVHPLHKLRPSDLEVDALDEAASLPRGADL